MPIVIKNNGKIVTSDDRLKDFNHVCQCGGCCQSKKSTAIPTQETEPLELKDASRQ